MEHWYAVHTHPKGEETAHRHLVRQGFQTYLPCYLKRRSHARRVDWVRTPLFPRYLFLRMDPGLTRWRAVQSTVGVSHLVCQSGAPAAVPDGVVEEIQAREDEDGLIAEAAQPRFQKGEKVQITSGPLCDQIGLFDCIDDNDRVTILLGLLGRQIKVRVPQETVCGAD